MGRIERRAVNPIDGEMLRALFAESRDDLAALPIDVRDVLLDLQYRAQHRHCLQSHPNARREILLLDADPVGYLVLDTDGPIIRVVLMCVTTRECGNGIDVLALEDLVDCADGKPVRVSVRHADVTARLRYERVGFAVRRSLPGNEASIEMEYQPPARPLSVELEARAAG